MTKPSTKPRLILFGIDAATFDVIKPAVEAGKLPTIGRMMKEGSWGVLKSIIPPLTAPAWTTIMTGVNPGKHGVFEFWARREDSYTTRLISSVTRKTPAIWDLLNQAGLRVGVLNVPITYPPEEIEGWMVSGMMGAPGFSEEVCVPRELAKEVEALVGNYPMIPAHKTGRGYYDFAHLRQQIASRTVVTMELLRKYPVDVVIVVCNYTDHVQHCFWGRPGFTTPEGEYIEDIILYTYQQADHFLEQLLDFCGEETTTLIISDHGAGPVEEYLDIEAFLVAQELVVLKDQRRLALLNSIKNLIPYRLRKKVLRSRWGEQTKSILYKHRTDCMNWPQTKAYNIGSYLGLRLNVKGREPQGCIDPQDFDECRQQIRDLLTDYRHPETGAPVFDIYYPEELFEGPYLSDAPDLLGITGKENIHLAQFTDSLFVPAQEMERIAPPGRPGVHRLAGVIIGAGPHLRAQALDTEAQLVDITPTVLYALGLPIPAYCDGQVLTNLFNSDFVSAHPPRYTDIPMQREAEDTEESVYSEQEHEQIKQRLSDLGYLD